MSDDMEFRRKHVGASEVAALFGESPWLTEFELWHRKAGNIEEPEFADTERSQWGVALEPTIIEVAAKREGWKLGKYGECSARSNGRGLGGHPDGYADDEDGEFIIECKCVDRLIVRDWGDEPPLHYLLQMQVYMGLSDTRRGKLIALVGGNELRVWHYDFRPKLFAEIEKRVEAFWRSIEQDDPPTPDFARDGRTVDELYGNDDGEHVDLSGDNYAATLAANYLHAKAREKVAKTEADAAKTELLTKIGTASTASFDGFRLSAKRTKDTPPTLITADMVGTTTGGRKGYRRFDLREIS